VKTFLGVAWKSAKRLHLILWVSVGLLLFFCAAVVLSLRYWILPDIERYHDLISVSVSKSIGQPVTIGRIEADWRGIRPHLLLSDVRILDRNNPQVSALAFHHVDGVVSWLSLLTGQVRLYSLELDQPDLLIKRDAQGVLHIAGVALGGPPKAGNNLADWLLHQSHILVTNARITWRDEQSSAPDLVLSQVSLLIKNNGLHHRFAVRALPPPELSAQLDLRGDLYGASFDQLNSWRGELYTELAYADVAAWRVWLPLPDEFRNGQGAVRAWMKLHAGTVDELTADVALAQVQAQLASDVLPLDLLTLHGRLAWRGTANSFQVSTRQLALQMSNGLNLPPTDFYLNMVDASGKQAATGELRANTLNLANLAALTDVLPLDRELKRKLTEFAPQGTVSAVQAKWQGDPERLIHYDLKGRFDQLALKRVGTWPGFSGISGEIDGSDRGGTLTLDARKLSLDAPEIMAEELELDTLTGKLAWRATRQGMEVKFSNVAAANADLAGTASGSFETLPQSPGIIDLTVQLTRGTITHANRYIPLMAISQGAHEWIRSALLEGKIEDFMLRMQGNLNDFPFADNKSGLFKITARSSGIVLDYAPGWPRIENGNGTLLIQGKRLEVTAPTATTVGEHLQNIVVAIPDMLSPNPVLQVRGVAIGETVRGLNFIQQSPVRGYIDGLTDDMTALGNGRLDLRLEVPLGGVNPVKVNGTYSFLNNEINLGNGIPILYQAHGDLLFTESAMRTRNAAAEFLGGPATLVLQTGADGVVQAKVRGVATVDGLRKSVAHPVLNQLNGSAEWAADISVHNKLADIVVTSDLADVASTLPAPFVKSTAVAVPLRVEMKSLSEEQDQITVQYGKLGTAKFLRHYEGGEWRTTRGTINFGASEKSPEKWLDKEGIWITGSVPQLALSGWDGLFGTESTGGTEGGRGSAIGIAGADVLIQHLDAYGYLANDLHMLMRNRNGTYIAQLAGKEANGEVTWQPQGKGKLVARLKNLSLNDLSRDKKAAARKPASVKPVDKDLPATEFPMLDLVVEDLAYNGKLLGRLNLLAQQHGPDWLLERMRIVNPGGQLTADGKWSRVTGAPQTQVNFKLEISDSGKILARSGYPNSVRQAGGKLDGMFSWSGGPRDFDYGLIDGTLNLKAGKGQFLKIDPGIGKLLGILSLQALPRHMTFDFADVFSEGFAFDRITGTAEIRQGLLTTDDLKLDGSAAKVTMRGQIDLSNETQNLRVRILPTVGNSVSLIGALALSPVIGVGAFIVNKLLREPLDKLASFEYNVTGTWASPNVEKIGSPKPMPSNTR
jgi:uncharacterized protein (TIGR02099 family)